VSEKKKINTKARLDVGFHKEVSHALIERHVSLDAAIQEGLRLWLDQESKSNEELLKICNERGEETTGDVTKTGDLAVLPKKGESISEKSGGIAHEGSKVETVSKATGHVNWLLEMTEEVVTSDHPVAPHALKANIISFHLQVEAYEAQKQQNAYLSRENPVLPPEVAARAAEAAAEVDRIARALERLRKHDNTTRSTLQKRHGTSHA
jgi:hypothetical protein